MGFEDLADRLGVTADADTAKLITDLGGAEAWVVFPDLHHLALGALGHLDARRLRHLA